MPKETLAEIVERIAKEIREALSCKIPNVFLVSFCTVT